MTVIEAKGTMIDRFVFVCYRYYLNIKQCYVTGFLRKKKYVVVAT